MSTNYVYRVVESDQYVWDVGTLAWVHMTQPGGGGGGAGDASAANQLLMIADLDTLVARQPTLGQKAMAASSPVVLASDQSSIPVTGTFFQGTQPVSGTVTTSPPANASTNVAQVAGTAADVNSGVKSAGTLRVVLATDQPSLTNKLLVTPDSVALPANQSVNVAQINGVTPLMGAGAVGTGSHRTTESGSATGTQTSVAGTVSADTVILASNAARLGATVYNDSTAILTLLVGAGTQSATVFTLKVAASGYYEVPFRYTGRISGSWASATGSARIVEYT